MKRHFAVALALLACAACDKSAAPQTDAPGVQAQVDAMDGSPQSLVDALRSGDEAALKAGCNASLRTELDSAGIADLSGAMERMGALESADRVRTEELVGGGEHGTYLLRFSEGDADLEIDLDAAGKVASFHFSGGDFARALAEARNASEHAFEVVGVAFRDVEGRTVSADAIVGEHVEYDMTLSGILEVAGRFHITVTARVYDASGKELYGRPIEFEAQFDANVDGRPVGTVHGSFDLLATGAHRIEFEITDDNAHATVSHQLEIVARDP